MPAAEHHPPRRPRVRRSGYGCAGRMRALRPSAVATLGGAVDPRRRSPTPCYRRLRRAVLRPARRRGPTLRVGGSAVTSRSATPAAGASPAGPEGGSHDLVRARRRACGHDQQRPPAENDAVGVLSTLGAYRSRAARGQPARIAGGVKRGTPLDGRLADRLTSTSISGAGKSGLTLSPVGSLSSTSSATAVHAARTWPPDEHDVVPSWSVPPERRLDRRTNSVMTTCDSYPGAQVRRRKRTGRRSASRAGAMARWSTAMSSVMYQRRRRWPRLEAHR